MYLSLTYFTKIFRLLAIAFIFSAISLFVFSEKTSAVAGINRQINFQGKLVNNPLKTNVTDTSYSVVFTIYDNSSGGTALWTETQTVTTADGIFRVALGSVTAFPANFNFNWDGLYLGMKVGTDSEMTPRVQLSAVPYAFNAEKVSGLTVQDTSGNASTSGTFKMANAKTFTVNNTLGLSGTDGKTLTISNSLTFAGTDSKTLNIGANNLTFDTSAGDSSLVLPISGTVCVNSNNCGYTTGTNWWTTSSDNKALTPINSTMDLLIGGTTTASAKFAFINVISGTPTASIAGNITLDSAGVIQTTKNQTLTLGGDTTGNIILNPRNGSGFVGINTTSPTEGVHIKGGSVRLELNDATDISANTYFIKGVANTGGVGWDSTVIGHNIQNAVSAGNIPLLNTSSGGLIDAAAISLGADSNAPAVFGIWTVQGGAAGTALQERLSIESTGEVGIGTTNPLATLDVRGNSGTTPVASVSGATSLAGLLVDNTGVGDLFTASKSGATKFTILNNGNLQFAGTTNFLTTLASAATAARTITFPDATGTICLSSNNCTASQLWATSLGALYPGNSTMDLLIGGTTTAAAKFAVININNSASPVASLSATTASGGSGNGLVLGADATIQSLRMNTLTLGGSTTGSIQFKPGALSNSSLFLKSNGDIGIGSNNTSPLASLDVRVNTANNGGTQAIASVSGKTSFAGLVVDNSGLGDIFTASSSGLTRFVIKQGGVVQIGDSTNGLTFDYINGGPTYSGSARPTKKIVLSPEYSGAILTASGFATTNGSMTSDASPSATFRTYYEWKSTQSTLQDYTVAVRVTLPQDFDAWTTSNALQIDFNTQLTTSNTNKLDVLVYNPSSSASVPVLYNQAQTSSSAKTWKTLSYTAANLGGSTNWNTAGQTATIYLKMYAKDTTNYVQVGDIVLNYLSKF